MNIFIDLDSTLCDTLHAWIRFMNEIEGKRFSLPHVTKWESPFEMYDDPMIFFRSRPYERDIIKPFPFAVELLENLARYGNVIILSDVFEENEKEKSEWILRNLGNVPFRFTRGDKERHVSSEDILVDDNPRYVRGVIENKGGTGILYTHGDSYSYNVPPKDLLCHPRFRKAESPEEIIRFVRDLTRKETSPFPVIDIP